MFVGRIVGDHIRRHWPSGSLVALHTAGSVPFFAPEQRYIDMLGLTDAHIARRVVSQLGTQYQMVPGHAKGDGDYVLARKPRYIFAGPAEGTSVQKPWFLSDVELAENPAFSRDHREQRVSIDVRGYPGYEDYGATASGELVLTYYERRADIIE